MDCFDFKGYDKFSYGYQYLFNFNVKLDIDMDVCMVFLVDKGLWFVLGLSLDSIWVGLGVQVGMMEQKLLYIVLMFDELFFKSNDDW